MARTLLIILACGAFLVGCGEPDASPAEARAAAQAAQRFYASLAGGDGAAACAVLADRSACTSRSFTDLPVEIRKDLTRVRVRPAGVDGETVDVEVTGSGRFTGRRTETLKMKRVDGAWRIDGRPAAFDPDRVTECIASGIRLLRAAALQARRRGGREGRRGRRDRPRDLPPHGARRPPRCGVAGRVPR
jgi:hypothetical protein